MITRTVYIIDRAANLLSCVRCSSWGHFKSGVSAEVLAEVADAMVDLGLRDAGCECRPVISPFALPSLRHSNSAPHLPVGAETGV